MARPRPGPTPRGADPVIRLGLLLPPLLGTHPTGGVGHAPARRPYGGSGGGLSNRTNPSSGTCTEASSCCPRRLRPVGQAGQCIRARVATTGAGRDGGAVADAPVARQVACLGLSTCVPGSPGLRTPPSAATDRRSLRERPAGAWIDAGPVPRGCSPVRNGCVADPDEPLVTGLPRQHDVARGARGACSRSTPGARRTGRGAMRSSGRPDGRTSRRAGGPAGRRGPLNPRLPYCADHPLGMTTASRNAQPPGQPAAALRRPPEPQRPTEQQVGEQHQGPEGEAEPDPGPACRPPGPGTADDEEQRGRARDECQPTGQRRHAPAHERPRVPAPGRGRHVPHPRLAVSAA
jgi:hypothetical protein